MLAYDDEGNEVVLGFEPAAPKKTGRGQDDGRYDQLFAQADADNNLPSGMTKAIANAETGFLGDWDRRLRAKSPAGAIGPVQFMPGTGRRYGLNSIEDLQNPEKAIPAAGRYLADIRDTVGSDDPAIMAAGYNAGEHNKYVERHEVPPPSFAKGETHKYVGNVLSGLSRFGQGLEAIRQSRGTQSEPETPSIGYTDDQVTLPKAITDADVRQSMQAEMPSAPSTPVEPPSLLQRGKNLLNDVGSAIAPPPVKNLTPPARPPELLRQDTAFRELESGLQMNLNPQFVEQVQQAYEASTPEQRQRLMEQPGETGQVARYIDRKYQSAAGVTSLNPRLAGIGGRREDVTARNLGGGMEPQSAAMMADREVRFPGAMKPTGQIQSTTFDFERANQLRNAGPLARGVEQGVDQIKSQAAGLNKMAGDLGVALGIPGAADYSRAQMKARDGLKMRQNEVGEAPNAFNRNLEGAIASTLANAPGMVAGLFTGGSAGPLLGMGAQVAGDEYARGIDEGLDSQQAFARSIAFGAAEIIGEKLGFKDQVQLLKNVAKGSWAEFEKLFVRNLAEQAVGEQFTTVAEARIDGSPVGLNKELTAKELFNQMKETLYQTVLQTTIMGAPGAMGAAARSLKKTDTRYDQQFADAFAPLRESPESAAAYDNIINQKVGKLWRENPEFKEILRTEALPGKRGIEQGRQARAILAEREAIRASAPPLSVIEQKAQDLASTPAQNDKPEDTTISSTGLPGATDAQDPISASSPPAGQAGQAGSAEEIQPTPDPATATPGLGSLKEQGYTLNDLGDGRIAILDPQGQTYSTYTDAQAALDDFEVSTTQEIADERQSEEAGTTGQEGLLNPAAPTGAASTLEERALKLDRMAREQADLGNQETAARYQQAAEDVRAGRFSIVELELDNANNPTGSTGSNATGATAGTDLATGAEPGTGVGTGDAGIRAESGAPDRDGGGTAPASAAVDPVGQPALANETTQAPIGTAPQAGQPAPAGAGVLNVETGATMPSPVAQAQSGIPQVGNPAATADRAESAVRLAPILQNRNRSNPASVQQMQSIAGNPDYLRLSPSRNFAEGAPVIAGGTVPEAQLGRKETTVTAKGRRIPVQYAVVEAGSVLASNNADGTVNAQYGDQTLQALRAIAGNGRIAGLQKAYRQGSAQQYRADLEQDDLHGVSPEVIQGMQNPVLVRLMPDSEITADIGDESNISGGLSLSPVEQAKNDAERLDLAGLDFDEDGTLGRNTVLQFVRSMPESEQGGLLDADGTPNRQAHDRLNSAVFQKAYDNEELVRLHSQAVDPEAKLVMSTLSRLAPKFSRLKGHGSFDVRPWLADAAKAIINGKRRDLTMRQIAEQQDLDIDPRAYDIIRLFADNPRSNKAVIEDLSDFADFTYNEATRDTTDMFGETPRATREDLVKRLENYRERRGQQNLAKRSRGQPVSGNPQEAATQPAGPDNLAETAQAQSGLFGEPTAADRANADREALAEAQREGQRRRNANNAPPADDGLFAQDNRQDELKLSLRPSERTEKINDLNDVIDGFNRRNAGEGKADPRSRVKAAEASDVPSARRVEMRLAGTIAAIFGHDVIYVQSESGLELDFDGLINPYDPSTLFIASDSASPISRVVAHELLHALRGNAPAIYDSLVASLRKVYKPGAVAEHLKRRGYLGEDDENLSDSQEEEWVADFVSDILHSPDALVRMAFAMNRHRSGTGASFLKRVQGFIERIKQGLAGYGQGAKGAIARSDLKTAEDAVIEALAKYADYRKSGTQPTGRLDIPFSLKPRDPNSATSITGDLARINAPAREAAEARLARLPKAEQDRVRATLEEHKSTPWAAAAIKGMVYREMLERARAGEDISALESNPVWGNQNMANTEIIKTFKLAAKRGDAAIRQLVMTYNFIGNNRKAEKDISTSFLNCDPSKGCAEHCYAADVNARPNEIAKSEFTEYALENFPDEAATQIARLYETSNLSEAGLALRLNDKGDLSEAQVDLVKALNDKGIVLQVFSKRPELLRKLDDANLKMLSVDSTNIQKAGANPDLMLAVTTTDGMSEDMLIPVQDRIAVVLPVNLKGVHHSKETLQAQFPNLAKSIIDDSLCPVEIGTFKTKPTTSFVQIEQALLSGDKDLKKQYKGLWTCTACDKLGTVGCFHGDRQTSQRKAKYLYEDSARKRMQVRQIQKDIENKLRELKALGYDVGDLRGELSQRLSEAYDAGQPEVRAAGSEREAAADAGKAEPATQGDAGSSGGAGANVQRRRFVITPVDDGPKFSNRANSNTLVSEPLQDDLFRQQLDLFLDADPAGQSGPKTQAAKRAAAAAVESLRGSDRGVLGRRLADTYAARQRVSLVGHTVNSREDVATLAQVYRDPRFETFRMFFLDQQGKIVSQVGLSSRLPSSSAVIVGSDVDKYLTDLAEAASKAGAVSYYMLHNHPSTNPEPSLADVNLTKKFAEDLGLISNGHVVIDTNQFGFIEPSGDYEVYDKDFGQVSPYKAGEFSGTVISRPDILMNVAKKIEVDKDAVTLIAVAASHKVLGVTTIPSSVIKDSNQSRRTLRIRKALKALNGAKAFAVGTDRTALMKMTGLVMDSIHINEAGEFKSMNEQLSGAYGMSDPFVVRGRNVPRVTADTSPEFDYLRNQTQALRTGKAAAAPGVAEEGPKYSNRRAPTFYSQLARGIQSSKMDSMPGSQWRAWLFSNQAKLGIKADEIAWTGIEDFLKLRGKEKTSKADIAAFLADNGVQVNEVMKGTGEVEPVDARFPTREAAEAAQRFANGGAVMQVGDEWSFGRPVNSTKFASYTIPGGENYRELLITLPTDNRNAYTEDNVKPAQNAPEASKPDLFWYFSVPGNFLQIPKSKYADQSEAKAYVIREKQPEPPADKTYRSSHWDEPNILAHLRFDERTDAEGNKVMFVQEIQSDWGQEGKKKGFELPNGAVVKQRKNAEGTISYQVYDRDGNALGIASNTEAGAIANTDIVPKAPFVTDTKSWTSLAIKRAIRHAAENGFDKIAFANGQQNADLYDLSKQVDAISLKDKMATFGEPGYFVVAEKNGSNVIERSVKDEKELADLVGKEAAEKLMSAPLRGGERRLEGVDLKVGGSGMLAFYDQIVPSVANDVLKKLGGGRVGETYLPIDTRSAGDRNLQVNTFRNEMLRKYGDGIMLKMSKEELAQLRALEDGRSVQPAIDITPAMRDKVLGEGMPLFSNRRKQTESPEFKKWFGDSKVVDEKGEPLVVYHGGRKDLEGGAFKPGYDGGVFFTDNKRVAGVHKMGLRGGAIHDVYLSLQNPYVVDFRGSDITQDNAESALRDAQAGKHDGVIIRNFVDIPEDKLDVAKRFGVRSRYKSDIYIAFSPTQIKSAIGNSGAFDASNPDIRFSNRRNVLDQIPLVNWTAPDEAKLDDWIYKLADKQIDTKRVVEKLNASDAWNPYQKETLYHGKAEYETNNFKVNEVKPLLDAMSSRGISIGDLETYLWNRHAPEANAYYARVNPDQFPDGGSGIKTQDALDYLANLPAGVRTDLEAIANQVDAILRETRALLVREGLETQETIDAWEAAYQHYIPLQRESAEISERGMGTGQGFSVKGPASKRRTGSGKAAADILAQVMMQRERVITRAEKNRVALSLYGLAIQNPNPGFWYAVNPDAITQPAKVAQELIEQGMLDTDIAGIIKEPTEARINPRTGLVEHKINPMLRNRPNVLAVRIKGKDRFLFFSTEDARAVRMAESLKNLDAADLGGVWNLFRTVTRYVSSINTQYNPIFGVVNLIRDTQGGMLNLSSTPLAGQQGKVMTGVGPALRGIYADLRADRKGQPRSGSEWSKLWEEFQQVGGKTGYRDMFRTAEDRGDALQKELQKAAEGKLKRFGRGVFDWLSDYNETLENAVRLSAYKAGIESGMTKDQSAVLAKDLTVNFNRKGQIASQMGSLYAFFNASAQGSVRLAQTLKGPAGKKIMAGGILLGVMQSVLMAMAGYDDDEPPEFVRERNFILPIGDGKYLTVPYPLGFHALPNMGRVVTDIALSGGRDGGKKVAGLLGSLFETFNPIGSAGWSVQTIAPTFADPLVALSENRDSFGKPIAKEDRSSLSPTPGFSRTKDTASVLSKKLAWGINRLSGGSEYTQGVISPTPDQLDFLFGQVTGGVGREVMKLEQAATSWMSGEELPPYKYPLGVGRFIGNTNAQASDSNRFYANLTRLNELEAELKGRTKEGEDVKGFMQDNPEASLVGMANAAETTVTKLRSMKRKMIAARRPKAEVKQIETRIQSVMKSLNDRVRPMRESPIERALRN